MRNMRYYLEDKPQYLDDPEGEYWFEKKGNGGRLYLRLPGDADPNAAQIEAGKEMNLVEDNDFRFTDEGILSVLDGSGWGYAQLRGRLGDVRIYRNHSLETGRRPKLY